MWQSPHRLILLEISVIREYTVRHESYFCIARNTFKYIKWYSISNLYRFKEYGIKRTSTTSTVHHLSLVEAFLWVDQRRELHGNRIGFCFIDKLGSSRDFDLLFIEAFEWEVDILHYCSASKKLTYEVSHSTHRHIDGRAEGCDRIHIAESSLDAPHKSIRFNSTTRSETIHSSTTVYEQPTKWRSG